MGLDEATADWRERSLLGRGQVLEPPGQPLTTRFCSLPAGTLAKLTCMVSMTMEKEWSWQSRASRYWQTPLKVKYLLSKLLKWDWPVTRHSPGRTQKKR